MLLCASASLAIALLPLPQLLWIGLVTILLVALLLICAEPTLGLAATIIAAPFTPYAEINIHPSLDTGQILFGVWLCACAVRFLYFRPRDQRVERQGLIYSLVALPSLLPCLLIFLCIAVLSFFPARSFEDWATECLKWVEIIILYLLVGHERDGRKRALIIGAIVFSAAYQGIAGLIQYTRGYGPPEFLVVGTNFFRAYGSFEQPNPFGGYMGLVWPFVVGVALALVYDFRLTLLDWRRRKSPIVNRKFLLVVCVSLVGLLAFSGVVTSGSRGARLGAIGAAAAMLLVLLPMRWRVLVLAVGLLIGLAALAFNLVPATLYTQIQNFANDYGSLDVRGFYLTKANFSNVERVAHWQAGLGMLRDYPWLGVGFGNYEPAYASYRLLYWANALGHAHNYYINIFAETGALGFTAYLLLWATILVRTWRAARSRAMGHGFVAVGLLGAWVHLTLHHLVDNLYVANTYLLFGVLLGLIETPNQQNATAWSQVGSRQPSTKFHAKASSR